MKAKSEKITEYNPLKSLISGFYDLQKVRIQTGNRIVANLKARLGQAPSKPESELDEDAKNILKQIRENYRYIADAAAELPRAGKFQGNEVISDYAEYVLAESYLNLEEQEKSALKQIQKIVHENPFWNAWMKHISGLGEMMAMVILACIDIHKAKYPSSLWKYCGVDVANDGKGRSRRKEHLILKPYLNKNGEDDEKLAITFNPFVKTKLLGVLAPSFLKAKNTKYTTIYYDYKNRLENHVDYGQEKKPGHRNRMALRYMIKMFLIDLHAAWCQFEGLPVSKPYHEAKLGITHDNNASQNNVENHELRASQRI